MKKYILPLFFVLVSCRAMLPVPDESDAIRAKQRWNQYDLAQLQQSHHLYVSKCGGCHTLYLPSHFKTDKWIPVIDEMSVKAKLSAEEKEMILNYLMVMSEKPVVTKKTSPVQK